jgi:hypothetical protein
MKNGTVLAGNWPRFLAPALLVLFAIFYYGSYALSGLDLAGEGGTIAVIAQRIDEGQRPLVDTFLGYNVLWFYPIVWLFRITGPNFIVVRVFFFVVSILAGLIGYRTVSRVTGRVVLGMMAGLVIILIPGMQFRNYMALLGVLNVMFLLEAFVLQQRRSEIRLAWIFGAGVVVAVTFLIRIDLGILFTGLGVAAIIFYPFVDLSAWRKRLGTSLFALAAFPLTFWIVHLPVDLYSARSGFRSEFWDQYFGELHDLDIRARSVVANAFRTHTAIATAPNIEDSLPAVSSSGKVDPGVGPRPDADQPEATGIDRSTLPLPKVSDMFLSREGKHRLLSFLIYYPIVATVIILGFAMILLVDGWRRGVPELTSNAFALFITVGAALTLFPQYFFFRPDPPHLSEMMCTFIVATACAFGIALKRFSSGSRLIRAASTVCMISASIHLALYVNYGIKQPWMGSIARKKPGEKLLRAENGVLAYVSPDKYHEYEELYNVVMENSKSGDYVVCYPYAPMINFMTNRPSYQYNLYVDNSTRPQDFDAQAITDIEKYRPAVILIDDIAMNRTDSSRFSVWAAPTLAYIRRHYAYLGTLLRNEVYVRPRGLAQD